MNLGILPVLFLAWANKPLFYSILFYSILSPTAVPRACFYALCDCALRQSRSAGAPRHPRRHRPRLFQPRSSELRSPSRERTASVLRDARARRRSVLRHERLRESVDCAALSPGRGLFLLQYFSFRVPSTCVCARSLRESRDSEFAQAAAVP